MRMALSRPRQFSLAFVFFFQAEDGIRDKLLTGVQTCALPIFGIRNNPDEWRLYYDLGFIYYTELHDYAHAADAFSRGSRVPHAHPFLKILAGQMAEHAGDLQTARAMWSLTYDTAQEKSIRANAAAHLRALQVDEDVPVLEAIVERFRQRTHQLPAGFAELARLGWVRGIPVDPLGHPYKLMADGRVEL